MRKVICLGWMFILIFSLSSTGFSKEIKIKPKNIISVRPIAFVLGTVNGQYERMILPRMSFVIGVNFVMQREVIGIGGAIGIKQYFSPKAPEGVWVGISGAIASVSTPYGSAEGFGGTIGSGYRVLIANCFNIEVSLNISLITALGEVGITPGATFKMGYAF